MEGLRSRADGRSKKEAEQRCLLAMAKQLHCMGFLDDALEVERAQRSKKLGKMDNSREVTAFAAAFASAAKGHSWGSVRFSYLPLM